MKAVFLFVVYMATCSVSNGFCKNRNSFAVIEQNENSNIQRRDSVKAIVKDIKRINKVESEYVGVYSVKSRGYKKFVQLSKLASTDELVALTQHHNTTVACYATWALVDRKYEHLPHVFRQHLQSGKKVTTIEGCIEMINLLSSELYYRYLAVVDTSARAHDKILVQLDSMVLHTDKSYWLLTKRAFENRVYANAYDKRIEFLAFNTHNIFAMRYLKTHYNNKYYNELQKAWMASFIKTDYSHNVGSYYKIVGELLEFRDVEINKVVIDNMKRFTLWKIQEEEFKALLAKYNIKAVVD